LTDASYPDDERQRFVGMTVWEWHTSSHLHQVFTVIRCDEARYIRPHGFGGRSKGGSAGDPHKQYIHLAVDIKKTGLLARKSGNRSRR
jgi:hypothetical protein